MNSSVTQTPARVFRDLLSTWHYDATNERIESLAADLVSEVVRTKAPLCLALIKKDALPKLFGLTYVFASYGLILRQRYRKQGDGIFVFVDLKGEA